MLCRRGNYGVDAASELIQDPENLLAKALRHSAEGAGGIGKPVAANDLPSHGANACARVIAVLTGTPRP
ncbi:hypothetical protein ACFQXB_15085 [Plastorhodobacter daqingensis]|uniref:Uncharacterized protein n=1 Tax=Plastorhodobacter daqingensis TaxID=1387281 RepID=A0ABW2UN48_9RHOB